jgi:HlyD family secretion protein
MRKLVATVLILGVIGGGGFWYYRYSRKPTPPTVTTAAVTRGDIVETVGATGTLQAVTTVQVGTQVSGTIASLGADFNSLVKKGQVIARLDPSLFQTQIEQARANLIRAQADLERLKVMLADAQSKLTRARELSNRQLIPRTDLETAEVNVQAAQAQIRSQEAQITQAQASLNQNQVNLEHTVITAPIDGLVISRSVDVGQTVAASMQAPTLFVLAADLTKMQVLANLDESDVGRIRPNQVVTFRVDAYPNDTFSGTVSQVRLEPKVQQNVVTYATVIDVPNNDLRLKPGMTANVNVEVARASNVLRVPNTSLRFRPSAEMFAALGQTPPEPQGRGGLPPGGARRGGAGDPQVGASGTPTTSTTTSGTVPSPASAPAASSGTMGTASARSSTASGRSNDARSPAAPLNGAIQPNGEGSAGGRRIPEAAPADGQRRNRFAERMQNLPPDERDAVMARMRERGIDPANPGGGGRGRFGGRGAGPGGGAAADAASTGAARRGRGASAPGEAVARGRDNAASAPSANGREDGATTIDALFAPLPRTETSGRAWVYVDNQLRPVRVRLGISDGQNTELIEGDLKEGTELVTNVAIGGQSTRPATTAFPGFGGPGGRGGFQGGGFPAGGGGNRGAGGGAR